LAIGPGVVLGGDPHAGQLFVQGRVRCGDRVGLFDEVVGRGWTLVSPRGDPLAALDDAARSFFRSLGGIAADVGAADVDGAYRRWFGEAGVAVVLQRPDFYIFGTETDLARTATLVRRLRDALGG